MCFVFFLSKMRHVSNFQGFDTWGVLFFLVLEITLMMYYVLRSLYSFQILYILKYNIVVSHFDSERCWEPYLQNHFVRFR